ncbi:transposase [Streptomyces sp. NPDC055632]
MPGRVEQWERSRYGHFCDRIAVGHVLADRKRWKQVLHWAHRRDRPADTYRAIVCLASDRTAHA